MGLDEPIPSWRINYSLVVFFFVFFLVVIIVIIIKIIVEIVVEFLVVEFLVVEFLVVEIIIVEIIVFEIVVVVIVIFFVVVQILILVGGDQEGSVVRDRPKGHILRGGESRGHQQAATGHQNILVYVVNGRRTQEPHCYRLPSARALT